MQRRSVHLFAYFFICVNCLAQQYPFVHYSPRDGLASNQVRDFYQDSRGRLYFLTVNGLSVYDGARFTNYSTKQGLGDNIVNCVLEMGEDSIWVVTNCGKINCLVRGKIKTLALEDSSLPVINSLYREENGTLYAASDQGLYHFRNGRFYKQAFTDTRGRDINSNVVNLVPAGNYFLVQRDNSILDDGNFTLYLYHKGSQQVTAEINGVITVSRSPGGHIWVSTETNIRAMDTTALRQGKIILQDLPPGFDALKNLGRHFIMFDGAGIAWLGDQGHVLIRVNPQGQLSSFTSASGLSMMYINRVFRDREGITWIATNNGGVYKLVHSNLSYTEIPFGIAVPSFISFDEAGGRLLVYSYKSGDVVLSGETETPNYYKVSKPSEFSQLLFTPHGIFGARQNMLYRLRARGNNLEPVLIFTDSANTLFLASLIDRHGNLVLCGKYRLLALVNGKTICQQKLDGLSDQAALDSRGDIWVATREGKLTRYRTRPGDPARYLEPVQSFPIPVSARSISIDRNHLIWIGTRLQGIHVFREEHGKLIRQVYLDKDSGLSDHFITHLACDRENRIWASTPSGLDRISWRNGAAIIENLTRQHAMYQSVYKVVIDRDNTAWALLSNGLIKITPEQEPPVQYNPALLISLIKAGKDTVQATSGTRFSQKQNNISFHFAATSFLDESQLRYSYRLRGGSNNQWSEPSTNSSVSFVDLPPGDYLLEIKASFPAARYPDQLLAYPFSVSPPWSQTWWFRLGITLLTTGLLVLAFRYYYRRKWEKQKAELEKQQAIEKERTRIASDMHDDLGAGLTRIKFITENIEEMTENRALHAETEKLKTSSNELVEKLADIIWAMNEKNNSLEDMVFYFRSYTAGYCAENRLQCDFIIPPSLPSAIIGGQIRRNVFLVLKESLHNIVKHAGASRVRVAIEAGQHLVLSIADDGKGFVRAGSMDGNGLLNMQKRAADLGGQISVIQEEGTTIRLEIPL